MHLPTLTFYNILMSILCACACGHFAKQRGRNPMIWFVTGGIFGILGLLALFILPSRKKTRVLEKPTVVLPPTFTLLSPLHADKFWYFLDKEKQQYGPMSFNALSKAKIEGTIGEQTYVWNEEMDNWKRFKDVIQYSAKVAEK